MRHIYVITTCLQEIIRKPFHTFLAIFSTLFTLIITSWIQNFLLIKQTISASYLNLWQKIRILSILLSSLTSATNIHTVIISILLGINTSLFVLYTKKRIQIARSTKGFNLLGAFLGILGVGCASCGSVILTSLFGLSTTISFLGFLPLKGQEFGLLSIGILSVSIYQLCKKIQNPLICKNKIYSTNYKN